MHSSWLSAWLDCYKSQCSIWSAAFLFVLWESEVGASWWGRPPAPLGTSTVCNGPFQAHLLSLWCWVGSDECLNLLGCLLEWKSPPTSSCEPLNTATSREITNPVCLHSPQATQQMWLREASAVYLLAELESTLHCSQRNWGFLLTCWMRLYHRSS